MIKMKIVAASPIITAMVVLFIFLNINSPNINEVSVETNHNCWNKVYGNFGGEAFDIIKVDRGYAVVGGYIAPGDSWSESDAVLLKINENGDIIFGKTYGGRQEDVGEKIIKTPDGYVVGGYTLSYGNGGADFWIIKVNKNGNELWNRTYGGGRDDFIEDVIPTSDGGYIMVGETDSYGEGGDMWVVKIDANGNELWSKNYGGSGYEKGYSILEADGGYIICGVTSSYGKGGWDFWVVKIDKNGNELWNKTYGYWDMEWAKKIIKVDDGYIVAGDTTTTSTGWNDILLIKIDDKGNEIWNKTYGGNDVDSLSDIVKTKDGYILIGVTESFDVGFFDGWMTKLDKNWNEVWNKSFGGRGRDTIDCGLYDNGYVMAGSFSMIRDGEINPYIWVIKSNDSSPSIIKITRPENGLYIFDRKLLPANKKIILGGITVVASPLKNSQNIREVDFFLASSNLYDYFPRKTIYAPPYQWFWNSRAFGQYIVTCAAYYGDDGAVAVDTTQVYMINLSPNINYLSSSK
ncbi:MAG: hypothetical protein J7K95_06250 [Thermoplasmata archaeon]|nr:hypothetical protein [Thermoplasmata archaeon]